MMKLKKTTLLVSGVLTACMASGALAATPEENRRDIDTITEILGYTHQILTAQNQKSDELLADIVSNSEQILENEGNIERNSAAIETNKANIDLLTQAALENKVSVEAAQAAVEENQKDIGTITEILGMTEQILTNQKQKVEELDTNKADKAAVEKNERDIGTITQILGVTEQILTAQNQKSDELLADIVSNSEQILENEGNIERNSAAIETNKANIDLLTPAVLENTVGVETNKAAVETVKQELAGKANAADVYAKAEVYNKTEADNLFALKANAQDVSGLTKRVDTVETALAGKADKTQVDALSNRVGKLEKDTRRGLATQAALAGLFQPYKVGRVNISAAVGGYKSESAVAVGAGYRFSEQFAAKLGVAANSGGTAYNFGVNYEF
ncbi:YadA-like family protein [Neisseria leonii]|uniref:YadA-like family protein n=1 Tax=Neisseria leonii TaxID=2995413 RepID=UPI0030CED1F3